MKQIYCLFFLACFVISNGQTITQSFNEPVVGDLDKNYRMDTSAYTTGMPLNITGSNCVWNFTNLTTLLPLKVDSFISLATSPSASLFPNATFVQHRNLTSYDLYTFYKSTSSPTQTELLGGYSSTLSLTFTNTAIVATYPVSYGYNLSDAVGGNFKTATQNGVCIGNIDVSANASGTLNLPNNISIPNVLCLRSVEILTLSSNGFQAATFNQTIYNYYKPGKKFPVINITYNIFKPLIGSNTITAVVYGSDSFFNVVGIKESVIDKEVFNVFPNPFTDRLCANAENLETDTEYLFYDSNSRLVIKTNSLADDGITNLAQGIYFLEIKNKLGIFHQKIIKG